MSLKRKQPFVVRRDGGGEASDATMPGGSSAAKPRAWQRMLSGRRLDLLNPTVADIEIEDIAHGLARVARWNGQTLGDHPFSVAQHSLLVDDILCALYEEAPRSWRMAALLHDAPEYVIGDLISPFKAAIGFDYKTIENRLLAVIYERFHLPPNLPKPVRSLIKQADRYAAYFEATILAGFTDDEADQYFSKPVALCEQSIARFSALHPWPAHEAQGRFLKRFYKLSGQPSHALGH